MYSAYGVLEPHTDNGWDLGLIILYLHTLPLTLPFLIPDCFSPFTVAEDVLIGGD